MSTPIDNGGPAFPTDIGPNIDGGFQCGNERWHCPWLSIRDYFAAAVMQGWLAGLPDGSAIHDEAVARRCYAIADAMMKARTQP